MEKDQRNKGSNEKRSRKTVEKTGRKRTEEKRKLKECDTEEEIFSCRSF